MKILACVKQELMKCICKDNVDFQNQLINVDWLIDWLIDWLMVFYDSSAVFQPYNEGNSEFKKWISQYSVHANNREIAMLSETMKHLIYS